MVYNINVTLVILGDIIFIAILILVVLFSCYFLIKRCILDYAIIKNLTSNNMVLPIDNVNGTEILEEKIVSTE